MHGRNRMARLFIPILPGRTTSGCHRPGRHCLHQARSAVRCSASRMKGERHVGLFSNHSLIGVIRETACSLRRMRRTLCFPEWKVLYGPRWPFVTDEEKPSLSLLLWCLDPWFNFVHRAVLRHPPFQLGASNRPHDPPHPVTEATSC